MTVSIPRWIAVAIAALLCVWIVAPASVPLYDSFQPDEHYRFLPPHPGWSQNGPPTTANAVVGVDKNGINTAQFCNSSESGPQISLYIPAGSLGLPPGTTKVDFTATPMAPAAPLPTDGTIVSDVYRLAATVAGGGTVTFVGKSPSTMPTLQMRAPTSKQPGPSFEHLVNGKWQKLHTLRVGVDVYQTFAPGFGDYALVQAGGAGSSSGGVGGLDIALIVVGVAILALVGIVALIRRNRVGT